MPAIAHEMELGEILARLARGTALQEGNLREVLRRITETAASALNIERVNIWLFDDAQSKITCVECYQHNGGKHSYGEELLRSDYPAYFDALDRLRAIAAMDAHSDPRTHELTSTYLRPHNIATLLDAPIYSSGDVIGVVCHEHVGSPRDWTAEEKSFAASIGDFVSLALEADRRLKAERNLAEREELSRSVAEQMPDALFLLDAEGPVSRIVVRYANQAACRMHGYTVEELVGRPFVILGDPGLATELARRFRQVQVGEEVVFEAVHRRRDGSTFPVEISSQAVHYAGRSSIAVLARDLTQRKQAEQERLDLQRCLLEAERLQSLGMLASGIAHDFGNLLLIIRMHMELIKRESLARRPSSLGSGEKTTDKGQMTKDQALADIEMAVQRAGEMCKALLAYAGKGRQTVASINLSRFAGETVRLLQVTMPAGAVLECELADPLPTIQGDATQLRQVVMNLITNAVEAVRDQAEGGRICIRTGVVGLDETQLKEVVADKKLAPGRYVYLEVSDTGCGMGEETRRRIFEPFFTTKRSGRGLGMAAVLGIVRTHGGGIHVASTPGEGTTVRILFPVPALN